MLTFFCPGCRAESRVENAVCPRCGLSLDDARRDYVDKLIELSLEHPVPSIPPVAAEILGRIGDRRAVQPLCRALLRTSDGALQQAAAEALGRLGDAAAVPALAQCLKNGKLIARLQAARSLALLGGPEAHAALEAAARQDPSQKVRRTAETLLEELCAPSKREGGR